MQTSRTRGHRLTAVAMAAAIGICANGLAADASGGGHHPQVLGAPNLTGTSSLPAALPADGSCVSVAGCNLYATAGSVDAGSATGIPIWGFTTDPVGPGRLGGDLQNTIIISEGQTLTLNVHNCLPGGAGDLFVEGSLHETSDPHHPRDPKHDVLTRAGVIDAVKWIPARAFYQAQGGPLDRPFLMPDNFDAARSADQ